jgi:hypothetical protein
VADALAADTSVTGFAAVVDGPDVLRKSPLDQFHLIYLINVPELPADGLDALEKFVFAGGGLVWFMGDSVRPAFYADKLYAGGTGLFPAPLAGAPVRLPRDPSLTAGADIVPTAHPLFFILSGEQNPFIDLVFVNQYYALERQWLDEQLPQSTNVRVVACATAARWCWSTAMARGAWSRVSRRPVRCGTRRENNGTTGPTARPRPALRCSSWTWRSTSPGATAHCRGTRSARRSRRRSAARSSRMKWSS